MRSISECFALLFGNRDLVKPVAPAIRLATPFVTALALTAAAMARVLFEMVGGGISAARGAFLAGRAGLARDARASTNRAGRIG
ncbi:MAG: hypothetical protein QM682_04815 [Paracoccus sp. (in: a-proteobacteria)]|uniref:hypothetical protein n=1 Tax=Paracoccus sp. TaxID=267 RepID=UPI0039E3A2FA